MLYEMYFYDKIGTGLPTAIKLCVHHFIIKHKIRPTKAIIREDEYVDGEYPVRVERVNSFLPPRHFMLGEVIQRNPRIFEGVRNACTGSCS